MDLDLPKPETPTLDTTIVTTPLETQEFIATQELEETNADLSPRASIEPPPSYVKLAMRNMVRKRGTSLQHFFLTTLGLLGVLVGLAYLTR